MKEGEDVVARGRRWPCFLRAVTAWAMSSEVRARWASGAVRLKAQVGTVRKGVQCWTRTPCWRRVEGFGVARASLAHDSKLDGWKLDSIATGAALKRAKAAGLGRADGSESEVTEAARLEGNMNPPPVARSLHAHTRPPLHHQGARDLVHALARLALGIADARRPYTRPLYGCVPSRVETRSVPSFSTCSKTFNIHLQDSRSSAQGQKLLRHCTPTHEAADCMCPPHWKGLWRKSARKKKKKELPPSMRLLPCIRTLRNNNNQPFPAVTFLRSPIGTPELSLNGLKSTGLTGPSERAQELWSFRLLSSSFTAI